MAWEALATGVSLLWCFWRGTHACHVNMVYHFSYGSILRILHVDISTKTRYIQRFITLSSVAMCPISLESQSFPTPGPPTRRTQSTLVRLVGQGRGKLQASCAPSLRTSSPVSTLRVNICMSFRGLSHHICFLNGPAQFFMQCVNAAANELANIDNTAI